LQPNLSSDRIEESEGIEQFSITIRLKSRDMRVHAASLVALCGIAAVLGSDIDAAQSTAARLFRAGTANCECKNLPAILVACVYG
jgi:hypothetical protein